MIVVLRIGHRIGRDQRVTTHVGLVARAFGANGIIISSPDKKIEMGLKDITRRFGGEFRVESCTNWRKYIKDWKGTIVHLTMYGEKLEDILTSVPKDKDLLIIVGAEKVPGDVYEMADFNIAIGNQPHSEVAALAIFLDRYIGGEWMKKEFQGKIKILPSKKGKKVIGGKENLTNIPSEKECISILKNCGCNNDVIEHCKMVTKLALAIGKRCDANIRLLRAGALLHDIGRSRTHGISHGVEGANIAKEHGLPESIVLIIERHLGAGISRKEAIKIGLPDKDFVPETLEEKIMAHADNLIAHNRKQKLVEAINRYKKRDRDDIAERITLLHRELSEICGIDLDKIKI